MSCECIILQTRGHCQTIIWLNLKNPPTPDNLPRQRGKKHNLSPTFCANTCIHAAQDITVQLSDTVTEEMKPKVLGYLEHVDIMGLRWPICFFLFWTTPTPSAATTPGARLHTSITEVAILPLAAVGSTAALVCIWIF